jgi:NAD(P)-dependent dehydrogenase (short-subunit alcohol dehydrogenase family)
MQDVTGKVAVVTGGASGIGLAMAQRFGQEGMKVVVADIVPERIDEAVTLLRGQGLEVHGVRTDVTKLESVEALAAETLDTYGGVHVVCNNAGIGPGGQVALWDYEPADWQWCIDVNVYGVAWGIKTFVPIMISQGEEGHIVNTTSGNGGIAPMADTPIYSVTKAAVVTMTETLLLHLRTRNTRLGASVLFPGPGMLRTKLFEAWATRPDEYRRETERTQGHFTYDDVFRIMQATNPDVRETPLEEVADRVLRAILEDRFWILPPSEQSDETLRKRYESMRDRRNPDYFREWKPEAAAEG